jgi:hypothetical protein
VGTTSNRPGIGARVEVEIDTPRGRRVLHRAVGSVSSFGGSPLLQHQIGLGDATRIRELRVRWPAPGGTTQAFAEVPLDVRVEVREGEAVVRQVPVRRVPIADR